MPRNTSPSNKGLTNVMASIRPRGQATPTPQDIRVRAYGIYVANGAKPGNDIEDWLQAERELSTASTVASR